MSWYVANNSDDWWDDESRKRYEDHKMVDALADFFRRASNEETAVLIWSM